VSETKATNSAADEPSVLRSLQLEDQLCFALYAASRAVTTRYRPLLNALGLTYPQFLVMLVLWERGSCTVKDLDEALRLDYGTVSPLLKRLETAGLLRRERRRDDERSVSVVLTAAGEALRDRAADVRESVACSMGLPPDEFVALRVKLRELTSAVAADGPAGEVVAGGDGRRRSRSRSR
jgi:MarR family transcriptional regulator, organic hydroperoxide resistance regulator